MSSSVDRELNVDMSSGLISPKNALQAWVELPYISLGITVTASEEYHEEYNKD